MTNDPADSTGDAGQVPETDTTGTQPPTPEPGATRTSEGVPEPTAGRAERALATAARYALQLESTVLGRLWSRLLELEFVDRSVALAAKAFVSFLPLLLLLTALTPAFARDEVVETITHRFGVSGDALDVVRQAFNSPEKTKAATGIFGAVVTLAFAVSFTTALQRTYLRAWRRPPGGGARNKGRGAIWLAGLIAIVSILTLTQSVLNGPTGAFLSWAIGLIATTGLWWWTAHLMLRGEVRWRPLLPTAVITGVGGAVYALAATVWMPTTVTHHFQEFGTFGIALSFVTWFTGLAFVIVAAAALGPALAEADDWLAHWLRSGRPTVLQDGAAASLPGPSRPVRLSDAFGRGSQGSGVAVSESELDKD